MMGSTLSTVPNLQGQGASVGPITVPLLYFKRTQIVRQKSADIGDALFCCGTQIIFCRREMPSFGRNKMCGYKVTKIANKTELVVSWPPAMQANTPKLLQRRFSIAPMMERGF